jgi:murein DD-endopeptidase MepM/ murein hydrolase activator NlpD
MSQKYKGYGNYILLKHNSTFKTAYAHLSKYGRGVRKGVRVIQGQIIGYVGSTGMSTGPHLHYEVIKNGKKINSQRLKLPTGKILNNEARNKFEVERIKIDVKLAGLRKN